MPRKVKPPEVHPKLTPYRTIEPHMLIREATTLSEMQSHFGATKARMLWDGKIPINDEAARILDCLTDITAAEWIKSQQKWEAYQLLDTAVSGILVFHGESSVRLFFHWFHVFTGRNCAVALAVENARMLAETAYTDDTVYQSLAERYRYGRKEMA